jgi:predicted glycosyltransferase
VHYTGYVVQPATVEAQPDPLLDAFPNNQPLIVTSVGGGRFGHELLEAVAAASPMLAQHLPHQIVLFTGPFSPPQVVDRLQSIAQDCPNLTVERYTPNLVNWLQRADLSISMAGYNTTMNVLTTGVRSLLLPFMGNDDQEQRIRCQRLEELGVAKMIRATDLPSTQLVDLVVQTIDRAPAPIAFDLSGVATTARLVRSQVHRSSRSAIAV